MNKAQELWLRMNNWEDVTERWDKKLHRWGKDNIEVRIHSSASNKAFINGWNRRLEKGYDAALAIVQTLNRLSR